MEKELGHGHYPIPQHLCLLFPVGLRPISFTLFPVARHPPATGASCRRGAPCGEAVWCYQSLGFLDCCCSEVHRQLRSCATSTAIISLQQHLGHLLQSGSTNQWPAAGLETLWSNSVISFILLKGILHCPRSLLSPCFSTRVYFLISLLWRFESWGKEDGFWHPWAVKSLPCCLPTLPGFLDR